MDATELEERWKRACRLDNLINRYPEPSDARRLVESVLERVRGSATPPDPILSGLAIGYASSDYESSGEARYLQLALLVREAAKDPAAEGRAALEVLTVLGQSSVSVLLQTWRGEAEIDGLTRLGNRRKMEAQVAALEAAQVTFQYASIDVDGLKKVNDELGHEAGDGMLRDVANELADSLARVRGAAFRYGGDEFGAVLENTSSNPNDLAEILSGAEARLPGGVKFSWGVAEWPTADPDISTVQRLADQRMYALKESRRQPTSATEA